MSVSSLVSLPETTSVQEMLAVLRLHGVQARYGNFIGGSWVAPIEGNYFVDKTPIDAEPVSEIAFSSAADVDKALDAAHAAKASWGHPAPAARAKVLNKIADRMEENLEVLALVETLDNGTAYRVGRELQAGRVWTNCYHLYPANAALGGYKQSGFGRETHKMILDHYQQTKNLLVSYSPRALGLF